MENQKLNALIGASFLNLDQFDFKKVSGERILNKLFTSSNYRKMKIIIQIII